MAEPISKKEQNFKRKLIFVFDFVVLVINHGTQEIADCLKDFYVEIVPDKREAKNARKRDKNLGNVNLLHVHIYNLQIFNTSVLKPWVVGRGQCLAEQRRQ